MTHSFKNLAWLRNMVHTHISYSFRAGGSGWTEWSPARAIEWNIPLPFTLIETFTELLPIILRGLLKTLRGVLHRTISWAIDTTLVLNKYLGLVKSQPNTHSNFEEFEIFSARRLRPFTNTIVVLSRSIIASYTSESQLCVGPAVIFSPLDFKASDTVKPRG